MPLFPLEDAIISTPMSMNSVPHTAEWTEQNFALEDAIGTHACWLEASMHVINSLPLGWHLLLTVATITHVATLKAIGVVHRRRSSSGSGKANSTRYYPTSSAEMIMLPGAESGGMAAVAGGNSMQGTRMQGHLITETNFKVYAYAPSPVQEALLSKFVCLSAPVGYVVVALTLEAISALSISW
jgi:hypothetical protein